MSFRRKIIEKIEVIDCLDRREDAKGVVLKVRFEGELLRLQYRYSMDLVGREERG